MSKLSLADYRPLDHFQLIVHVTYSTAFLSLNW